MTVNYIMKEKPSDGVKTISLVIFYVILYLLFFEFILPVNFFLPRPFLLGDSLISLQTHYRLLLNLFFTVSSVYASIISGYFLLSVSAGLFIRLNTEGKPFLNSLRIFKYFPLPAFAVIFALWLQNAFIAELLFALIMSYLYFLFKLSSFITCIKSEYVEVIIPLGIKESVIFKDIIWKSLTPSLLKTLNELNFVLWTLVLFFEIIKGNSGIGFILRMSYEYQDLSGLFILSILTGIIMFLGNASIKLVQKKLIRWEP